MSGALQAWALARGDRVVAMVLLCPAHVSFARDQAKELAAKGLSVFRVKAKAMVRSLPGGCLRCGGVAGVMGMGAASALLRGNLEQEGGEA